MKEIDYVKSVCREALEWLPRLLALSNHYLQPTAPECQLSVQDVSAHRAAEEDAVNVEPQTAGLPTPPLVLWHKLKALALSEPQALLVSERAEGVTELPSDGSSSRGHSKTRCCLNRCLNRCHFNRCHKI